MNTVGTLIPEVPYKKFPLLSGIINSGRSAMFSLPTHPTHLTPYVPDVKSLCSCTTLLVRMRGFLHTCKGGEDLSGQVCSSVSQIIVPSID